MKRLLTIAGVLIIPAAWYAASKIAGEYVIPAPWTTIYAAADLLSRPGTWMTMLITIGRVVAGFCTAMVIGAAVGVLTARRSFDYLLRPAILLMQGVPPILWAIPLILVMGFSRLTPIVVIALICFPLAATNVSEGMRTLPVELKEMLDIFAPGFRPRLRELVFPHLRPFLVAAVRLGIGLGIKASVIAEYFAANDGIGFEVQTAYQAFLVQKLFAWALILILLILGADAAVRRLSGFLGTRRQKSTLSQMSERHEAETAENDIVLTLAEMDEQNAGIVVNNLAAGYAVATPLVRDVSLRVDSGHIAVVSGDSGTGKTTLLKAISGILEPLEGDTTVPEHLGYAFQDDRFLPWINNIDNTSLALRYQGYSTDKANDFARYLLSHAGLAGTEDAFPDELSGGMKKRLAFARSFACMPGALLLDEPFTGLHHEARAELWAIFTDLVELRPVPVIVVTHFPEEVPKGPKTEFYRLEGAPATLFPA